MNKKNLLFLMVLMCVNVTHIYGMEKNDLENLQPQIPENPHIDSDMPDNNESKTTIQILNPAFLMTPTPENTSIKKSLKSGFYGGIQQGVMQLVMGLITELVQGGIILGVKWWTQPNKDDLEKLTQKMQFNKAMKDLEKSLEQERKSLIDESTIVMTSGSNVEKAQLLYAKQLEQKKQETEIAIETEIKQYTQMFERAKENNINKFIEEQKETYEQKLNEFKQNLDISHTTSLSAEQLQKFNKKLEIEKTNYVLQQNKKYADQIEKLQDLKSIALQNANNALEKENPNATFIEIFSEYNNSALNYFRNKRKLREGALLSDILQNQKSTDEGEPIEDIFDMLTKRAAAAEIAKTT